MKLTKYNNNINFILNKINLIKYPLKTKKSQILNRLNKVVLIIHKSLTKTDLKEVFNFLLPNQIKSINLLILPKKKKRIRRFKSSVFSNSKRNYKKAYITLNQNIFSSIFFNSLSSNTIDE